jgi:membrane protein DedA with SNARE-associated domain
MSTVRRPHSVGVVMEWLADVGNLPTALLLTVLGGVMVLDAIPLVGVLVPGDVAVLGAMAARGPAGGAGVLVGVVAGCLAGWSASFLAGRYFGARLRRGRLGAWIGEARWAAAERAVRRGGGRIVMVAPFLPVLNALVPLAAGGLRMSYRRFLASAAVGGALWAGCYVALGALADALGGLLPGETFAAVASVVIGLTFGWIVLLATRRRLARAEAAGAAVTAPTDPAIAI